MKKIRYDRKFIAALAFEVLAPLVEKSGQLREGRDASLGYKFMDLQGLRVMCIKGFTRLPGARPTVVQLDVWLASGGKVFSAAYAPLEIVSFRPGAWIDQLIEVALQVKRAPPMEMLAWMAIPANAAAASVTDAP